MVLAQNLQFGVSSPLILKMQDIEPVSGDALLYGGRAPAQPAAAIAVPNTRPIAPKVLPGEKVTQERRTVSDDDDQATAATVAMMCDYIRAGIADPVCQAWAAWCMSCFGMGSADPRAKFWAVFWGLKHAVRYRRDEPELFRIGERSARDLLTAPAVLVRQDQPAEDCDGFTMLACTLLRILGLDAFIVTVKVDPNEPGRWSHVFAMADIPGVGLCALDGSHGQAPGWMVPRSQIFGYQVWDLSGKRIHKQLPVAAPRLNGYAYTGRRRRRGMGDDDPDAGAISQLPVNQGLTDTELNNPWLFNTGPGSGLPTTEPNPLIQSAGGGSTPDWETFLNQILGTAGRVATIATAPAGSVVTPNGQVIIGGASSAQLMSSLSGLLPFLAIGAVIWIGASAIGGKGKH